MAKKPEDKKNLSVSETGETRKEKRELEDLLKRVQAEYLNYKKRTEEEKAKFFKIASKEVILKVLPVLDNLDRALKHTPKELEDSDWAKGFGHIESQFENILKSEGLEIIETEGKHFDYNLHEAISFEDNEEAEDGEILKEFEKGYTLNGQIIRPAKVIVCKK